MRANILMHRFGDARRLAVAALAASAVAMVVGSAQADNFADALVETYKTHPDLAASRASLRSVDEAKIQQEAQGKIRVDGDFSYSAVGRSGGTAFSNNKPSDPFIAGVTASLPLYTGGRIANAIEGATDDVNGARASLRAVEQDVLLAAVTAYMDVRRDGEFVSLARNNVRVISEQLRAAQDRFSVGEVTRTDVSQAEARLAAARSILAANTGALARSRQAYVVAVGLAPGQLSPPPPLPDLPDSLEEATALAEANHPLLEAARHAARSAEKNVKIAIGAQLPTVSLNSSVGYDNNIFTDGAETGFASVTIAGTVPLYTGGENPSRVRQAQAIVSQRQAQIHDTARFIRQSVAVAWANLEVARASIVANRQQIRAAQLAYEGVSEEAKLGSRTTLDVLDAEQELLNARSNLVGAQRDEYVAGYNLLSSVGSLSVKHLGLNAPSYDIGEYEAQVRANPRDYPKDGAAEWSSIWRP
jgi:outer membrane protein